MTFEAEWKRLERVALQDDEYPLLAFDDAKLDRFDDSIVEALVERLDHDDLRIVLGAALGLEQLPRFSDLIIPHVVARLADPHPWIAEAMMWIIHEHGDAALPALRDQYASTTDKQRAQQIARAIVTRGPNAIAARELLADDTTAIAAITGPWPTQPSEPIRYLGESVRMDDEGPWEREAYGRNLWLEAIQRVAMYDEDNGWHRTNPEAEAVRWWPSQIAIAAETIKLGMYSPETEDVIFTEVQAPAHGRFTNHELLYAALVAHHEHAPVNDRIFEGLERQDDGSYYINTGS